MSASYPSAPAPPAQPRPGMPAGRLPCQPQMPEPPACVQNAMMTKDKKPFTYTPGGIDLSQIKSPRMAKRLQQNANSEGVVPKPSPLAQGPRATSNGSQIANISAGLPVQVFPVAPKVDIPSPTTTSKYAPQLGRVLDSPVTPNSDIPSPPTTTSKYAPQLGRVLDSPVAPKVVTPSPTTTSKFAPQLGRVLDSPPTTAPLSPTSPIQTQSFAPQLGRVLGSPVATQPLSPLSPISTQNHKPTLGRVLDSSVSASPVSPLSPIPASTSSVASPLSPALNGRTILHQIEVPTLRMEELQIHTDPKPPKETNNLWSNDVRTSPNHNNNNNNGHQFNDYTFRPDVASFERKRDDVVDSAAVSAAPYVVSPVTPSTPPTKSPTYSYQLPKVVPAAHPPIAPYTPYVVQPAATAVKSNEMYHPITVSSGETYQPVARPSDGYQPKVHQIPIHFESNNNGNEYSSYGNGQHARADQQQGHNAGYSSPSRTGAYAQPKFTPSMHGDLLPVQVVQPFPKSAQITASGPNQSKSFRVLQHITDTAERNATELATSGPAELQAPHYARTLGPHEGNQTKSSLYNGNRSTFGQDYQYGARGNQTSGSYVDMHYLTQPENVGPGQSDL